MLSLETENRRGDGYDLSVEPFAVSLSRNSVAVRPSIPVFQGSKGLCKRSWKAATGQLLRGNAAIK